MKRRIFPGWCTGCTHLLSAGEWRSNTPHTDTVYASYLHLCRKAERKEIRRSHDRNIYFCEWKQAADPMTHHCSVWGLRMRWRGSLSPLYWDLATSQLSFLNTRTFHFTFSLLLAFYKPQQRWNEEKVKKHVQECMKRQRLRLWQKL